MSAAEQYDGHDDAESYQSPVGPGLSLAADVVEVRRNTGLSALVGLAASAVAIAWFSRAIESGGVLDWIMVAVTGLLAVVWLGGAADSTTPLLVADQQGVRARLGREWIGLPWSAVARVDHRPRRRLGDGVLDVVPHNTERLFAGLTPAAARQARIATRLHGGPLALPLGWGTRVQGGGEDLGAALEALGAGVDASAEELPEPDPAPVVGAVERLNVVRRAVARSIHVVADRLPARTESTADVEETPVAQAADGAPAQAVVWEDAEPSPAPEPIRDVTAAIRADVVRPSEVVTAGTESDEESVHEVTAELPVGTGLDTDTDGPTRSWSARVRPIARESHPVEPLVIDDIAVEPALDPVIGPEIRAARTRIGLSTEELAERTRIRPHVIEAIEVDDFVPCGGDFYARGHLRTLARVLGLDVQPLLTHYDERYTGAPIDARRVFEAELASGGHGPIRGMRGGPNWSVLVAAVMAVVLCWSVAQLVMDAPTEVRGTPVLDGSGGPGGAGVVAESVKVKVTAPTSGAEVVVRDQAGKIVFKGRLAIGESHDVEVAAPVRVQSSDGSVTVEVAGKDRGAVGEAGSPAQGTYAARR